MTQDIDSPKDLTDERKRIVRSRNRVLALILFGFVVLTFAISLAKIG